MLDPTDPRLNDAHPSAVLRLFSRAAFFIGLGLRKTSGAFAFPFRALAGRSGSGSRRWRQRPTPATTERRVVSALSRMTNRVQRLEKEILARIDKPPTKRRPAPPVNETPADEATAEVLDALQDSDPNVRCQAADAAGQAGLLSCVFSLILLLDDPEVRVRQRSKIAIEAITGRKIGWDLSKQNAASRKQIEQLKDWWKKERFTRLANELETVVRR